MQDEAAQERSERVDAIKLELLLRGLEGTEALPEGTQATPELTALRDTARRLRAASQWVPLPERHRVVRRVLEVAAQRGDDQATSKARPWRWVRLWLGTATAVALIGAFGLGAGALDALILPSNPAYSLRLTIDKARDMFTPGGHRSVSRTKSPTSVRNAAATRK